MLSKWRNVQNLVTLQASFSLSIYTLTAIVLKFNYSASLTVSLSLLFIQAQSINYVLSISLNHLHTLKELLFPTETYEVLGSQGYWVQTIIFNSSKNNLHSTYAESKNRFNPNWTNETEKW